MVPYLVALLVLAAILGAAFLVVWRADAKRADEVETDGARAHTDEHLPSEERHRR